MTQMMRSVKNIEISIDAIKEVASTNSRKAHEMEEQLYRQVLRWISQDAPEPFNELARAVIKAHDIEFTRWY